MSDFKSYIIAAVGRATDWERKRHRSMEQNTGFGSIFT